MAPVSVVRRIPRAVRLPLMEERLLRPAEKAAAVWPEEWESDAEDSMPTEVPTRSCLEEWF